MDLSNLRPSLALVIAAELLLGALFLVGLGAIALLPAISADLAATLPEYEALRAPLLAVAIAFAILALVALALIGLLVYRVYSGSMLTRGSLRWVDVLVVTLGCAVVVLIAGFIVIDDGQAGTPILLLALVVGCLTFFTVGCVTLVLRSLLRNAIALRAELDEVV